MSEDSRLSGPAYRIHTARLVIRCWAPEDGPRLRHALDELDEYLRPWIPWMRDEPQPLARTVARLRMYRAHFDLDRDYRYAVLDRSESELIGETGLYARIGPGAREIGYWIHARHAGSGYALEAAAAMVRVAFEVEAVDRVEIHCAPDNAPSRTIPEKLGFAHEATLRQRMEDSEGRHRDAMIWTLFKDVYPASKGKAFPIEAFDCLGQRLL